MNQDLGARLAREVVVVLVEPQHPGNVGAAARALANFGLSRLVVVNPADSFDPERARWMAPGADDVLEKMRIVATLDEALEDVHEAIATTSRHRRHGQRVETTDQAATRWAQEPGRTTAILFGREDTGLTNDATTRCATLLRIPTAPHASLNLSMAVLLVAQRWFAAAREEGLAAPGRIVGGRRQGRSTASLERRARGADALAPLGEVEPAVLELVGLLNQVGYRKANDPDGLGVMLREVLQRAGLTSKHTQALRGMIRRVGYAIDHPEIDWRMSKRQKARLAELPPHEE